MQDIRVALRQFRKSPGFALTVILTIALGIGANTAIFTLVHAVLLKSLPVTDPKTLFRVGDRGDCCVEGGFINDDGDFDIFSYDLYKHFRDTTPEFEQLAAMQSGGNRMTVRRGSEPAKSERSEYVSGNFFSTFGIGSLRRTHHHRGRRHSRFTSYGDDELPGLAIRIRWRSVSNWRHILSAEQTRHSSWHRTSRILRRPHQQQSSRALDSSRRRAVP